MSKQTNESKPEVKAPFHAVNWFEIPSRNIDRAAKFYEVVIGRPLKRENFGGMPHAVFASQAASPAQYAVSGAVVEAPHLTPGASGSVVYLDCPAGVAATFARAMANGGKQVVAPMSIGEHGWIALVDDPEGNRIGLHAMQP